MSGGWLVVLIVLGMIMYAGIGRAFYIATEDYIPDDDDQGKFISVFWPLACIFGAIAWLSDSAGEAIRDAIRQRKVRVAIKETNNKMLDREVQAAIEELAQDLAAKHKTTNIAP
jgi:hypothetical protein